MTNICFLVTMFRNICCILQEENKKIAPKLGRKKSKKSDPAPTGANTPRTRATVAREEATRTAMEAEQAAAKASAVAAAAKAATGTEMDVELIEVEPPEPSTPPRAKR